MAPIDPKSEKANFARNLVRLRRATKTAQKTLAGAVDKSTRQIRRWENPEDTSWPTTPQLPIIAHTLKCSIDDLFGHENTATPTDTQEREILEVVRKTKLKNLPVPMITNAVSMLLLHMTREERETWMKIGNLLSDKK